MSDPVLPRSVGELLTANDWNSFQVTVEQEIERLQTLLTQRKEARSRRIAALQQVIENETSTLSMRAGTKVYASKMRIGAPIQDPFGRWVCLQSMHGLEISKYSITSLDSWGTVPGLSIDLELPTASHVQFIVQASAGVSSNYPVRFLVVAQESGRVAPLSREAQTLFQLADVPPWTRAEEWGAWLKRWGAGAFLKSTLATYPLTNGQNVFVQNSQVHLPPGRRTIQVRYQPDEGSGYTLESVLEMIPAGTGYSSQLPRTILWDVRLYAIVTPLSDLAESTTQGSST